MSKLRLTKLHKAMALRRFFKSPVNQPVTDSSSALPSEAFDAYLLATREYANVIFDLHEDKELEKLEKEALALLKGAEFLMDIPEITEQEYIHGITLKYSVSHLGKGQTEIHVYHREKTVLELSCFLSSRENIQPKLWEFLKHSYNPETTKLIAI